MEYKELIKIVEEKKKKLVNDYNNSLINKKVFNEIINKYDELLFDLYNKYEKYLTK